MKRLTFSCVLVIVCALCFTSVGVEEAAAIPVYDGPCGMAGQMGWEDPTWNQWCLNYLIMHDEPIDDLPF